jgi:hypothetical protein
MTTTTTDVRAELAALVAPLRAQLAELDAQIAERTNDLFAMQAARRDAMKALVLLDPSSAPPPTATKAKQAAQQKAHYRNGNYGVAPETLASIRAWLDEHAERLDDGTGFTARSLEEGGFDLTSRQTLGNALHAFHDQGVLRIDHRIKGGGKAYKLARSA